MLQKIVGKNGVSIVDSPKIDVPSLDARIIDLKKHAPILKFNAPTDFQHLLNPFDQENVKALAEYLIANKFEVYIGGGVVQSALTSGQRTYGDIDLLVTGNIGPMGKLAYTLNQSDAYSGAIFQTSQKLFTVKPLNAMEFLYMNGEIACRYALVPTAPIGLDVSDETMHNARQANLIDLSLVGRERFKRNYRK
jgi:hypothetical protein